MIRAKRTALWRWCTCTAIRPICWRAFAPTTCTSSRERYRSQIADAEDALATAERGEKVALTKRIKKLKDQLTETVAYEEKLHHLADQMIKIDLDDGVKVNYAKFQDVLAKIKIMHT